MTKQSTPLRWIVEQNNGEMNEIMPCFGDSDTSPVVSNVWVK